MIPVAPAASLAQWGLFFGNLVLLVILLWVAWKRPMTRPWTWAMSSLCLTHLIYYYAFLVKPGWLTAHQTVLFSITLRYQTLFLLAFILASLLRGASQPKDTEPHELRH